MRAHMYVYFPTIMEYAECARRTIIVLPCAAEKTACLRSTYVIVMVFCGPMQRNARKARTRKRARFIVAHIVIIIIITSIHTIYACVFF